MRLYDTYEDLGRKGIKGPMKRRRQSNRDFT